LSHNVLVMKLVQRAKTHSVEDSKDMETPETYEKWDPWAKTNSLKENKKMETPEIVARQGLQFGTIQSNDHKS